MNPKLAWAWIALSFVLFSVAYNSANVWAFLGGSPGSDPYWDFQAWTTYLSRFWWALSLVVWVPLTWPHLLVRYMALAATVSLGIDLIDLATTGDYDPNWIDSALWFVGVPYSIISYFLYRKGLKSDTVVPGAVYVVSNPPHDLLQLVVSFTPWGRGRGNVAVWYNGGYYFASTRSCLYERHDLPRLRLREGQVLKRLDVDPEAFSAWWEKWEGQEYSYRRNCFRSVADLVKGS